MKQYPEQAAVLSLEELLDGKDSVTFDSCSIFIDSVWDLDVHNLCSYGMFEVTSPAYAASLTGISLIAPHFACDRAING